MKQAVVFLLVAILIVQISAKPADKHSERIHEDKPLSDQKHYEGDGHEHNAEFDHEAFLGAEEAKTFNDLSPEESKKRLGKIAEKIDADKDGYVTETELKEWIEHQQKKYIYDDVERQWKGHNLDGDSALTWDEYNSTTYSGLPEEELLKMEENERMDFATMIRRDKARWEVADVDKNDKLEYEEFVAFIHPEERDHMFDVVVEETMEDIDKNHDGKLSVDEYIGDMFHHSEGDDKPEPDWVKNEREQFGTFRDKNGDGHMDHQEVKDWILPTDYDHAEAEAKHLVYESDVDKDKKLTVQEIVDKWDLFVGSQATDFGDALTRHDEF